MTRRCDGGYGGYLLAPSAPEEPRLRLPVGLLLCATAVLVAAAFARVSAEHFVVLTMATGGALWWFMSRRPTEIGVHGLAFNELWRHADADARPLAGGSRKLVAVPTRAQQNAASLYPTNSVPWNATTAAWPVRATHGVSYGQHSRHVRMAELGGVQDLYQPALAPTPAPEVPPPPEEPKKTPTKQSGKGSVLVFGWFQASTRELALVEKIYKREGYDEVVLMPSKVSELTKPQGWYRKYMHYQMLQTTHPLARHFDVVHCLSGGFLGYYLVRGAGVPLTCSTLLLDSTPILPKPGAFTTFTREFLSDAGLRWAVNLFPKFLHQLSVRLRWMLGSTMVRLRHRLSRIFPPIRLFGRTILYSPRTAEEIAPLTTWTRMATNAAFSGTFDHLIDDAVQNTLSSAKNAPPPGRTVFLYNPDDPYLCQDDVTDVISAARRAGTKVETVHVQTSHVQTIFRDPRTLFGALSIA